MFICYVIPAQAGILSISGLRRRDEIPACAGMTRSGDVWLDIGCVFRYYFWRASLTFDTYKIVKQLTSEGIAEKQATVIVQAIQEGREIDNRELVTKAFLKAELQAGLSELEIRMMGARKEDMRWIFSLFLAVIGLLITITLKLH